MKRLALILASLVSIVGNGSNVAASVAMSGDATISNGGAVTIANNAVTNAKSAQMAAHTYKGNNTGSTANAADITNTQLTADLNLFTTSLQGLTPASGGGTTNFLRADGNWAAPAGGGSNSSITPTTTDLRVPWGARPPGIGSTSFYQYGIYPITFPAGTATNGDDSDGLWVSVASPAIANNATFAYINAATTRFDALARIWARIKPVDTTALRFFFGYHSYAVGDPTTNDTAANTMGFRYNPAIDTGGTIRFYTTDNGGTANTIDTGVSYSGPHTLCLDASNTSSIKGYIDGVLVATSTTNLPTITNMDWFCSICPTTGTAKSLKMGGFWGDSR